MAQQALTIFLDIDGVLNNEQAFHAAWEINHKVNVYVLDEECVRRLVTLVKACTPEPQIVLSSTWRLGDRGMNTIKAKLAEYGLALHSVTPRLSGDMRGEEIAAWLAANGTERRFVILDDDSDMLPDQLPFFVQTATKTGLLDEHVRKATEILGIPVDWSGP